MFREPKTKWIFTCGQTHSFLGFLFILLFAQVANGATVISQYGSRLWRADDGLLNSCVQSVIQTRDGYLWMGTQFGLARFDGVRFVGFNRNNVPEMLNSNILGLQESKDGSLWIATGRGGLMRLKDGKFTRFGKTEGLANNSCLGATLETRDGSLWFATLGGLSRYKDGRFVTFGMNSGLASDVVRGMVEDQQGQLWLATPKGVYCWKDGKVIRHFLMKDGLRSDDARTVYCDSDGTIWVGAGNGLSCIQEGSVATILMPNSPANNIITRIQRDRRGNLWVGGYGGLSQLVDGKIVSHLDRQGQAFDLVNAIFEDREGNLWIGSRDGLIRLNSHPFTSYTQQHGLSFNNVTSVLEGKDGEIWAATWGGGVNRFKDGVFTTLHTEGFSLALGLCEDSSQRIWAGSDWDGGLYLFEREKKIRKYGAKDGLTGGAVRVVHQDRSGIYWLGTSRGLFRMEGKTIQSYGTDHGMPAQVIRAICEDDKGDIWIGTNDGLWRLHEGKLVRFTTADGLSDNTAGALYPDHRGNLWIGTSGGGLNRYRDGRFTIYNTRRGLFNDNVYEIVEDDNGWLWMTSIRGIFRVHRNDLDKLDEGSLKSIHCIAYGNPDGLASEVCSMVAKPGAFKSKDGRLWFATAKGLSVVDPNSLKEEIPVAPPVILERILTDKQAFPAAETLSVSGPVRIPPGRGELEFQYTALAFRAPERTRFKYRLEGVDTDWVEAGSRRTAHYNNVYPGKYRFQVLARNSESTWSDPGSIEFVVLPHVWQTWWFRLGIVAVPIFGAFGIHRVRLGQLRQMENLRLRLAADLHDEVGSNISTISLLARKLLKGGSAGTDAAEDVAAINRISTQTSSSIREIAWFINPGNDTLQDLILRMKEAANTMLPGMDCRFHGGEEHLNRTLPPQFRQDVFLLFKEVLANIAKHSRASRVEIEVSQLDGRWQFTVRDNGIGFDTQASHTGNGLKNLRLRAARLYGSLKIDSNPGSGTIVTFSVRIP